MPQVDKISFFPQVFWLLFVLLFFYIFYLRCSFTSISNSLKIRNFFFIENNQSSYKNKINIKILMITNILINTIFSEQLVLNNKFEILLIFQAWLKNSIEIILMEIKILEKLQKIKINQTLMEQNFCISEDQNSQLFI